jgi:pyocin large subunit-like protein
LPFIDAYERQSHFQRHQHEFKPPFQSEFDYEAAAETFMDAPKTPTHTGCIKRSNECRIRFDITNRHIAVQRKDGKILTYHVVWQSKIADVYVKWECSR